MSYSKLKTVKKAVPPAGILIILNIIIAYCKQNGIEIDAATAWQIALGGYGAFLALKNWIKNRKKGKEKTEKNEIKTI